MSEDQNSIENVEIEPLSDEDLADVAGGVDRGAELLPGDGGTSSGPSCCSCSDCSR